MGRGGGQGGTGDRGRQETEVKWKHGTQGDNGQGGKNGGQRTKGGTRKTGDDTRGRGTQGSQGTEGEQGTQGNGTGTEVRMITAQGVKGTEGGHTCMRLKEEWRQKQNRARGKCLKKF